MKSPRAKLYLIFLITFLVMHFTGIAVAKLPYIINALVTSLVVLTILLLLQKWISGTGFATSVRNLGLHSVEIKKLIPGIAISFALLLAYPIIARSLDARIFLASNWYLNLIGLFLTAGLTEEILFRAYLFGSLRREMSFRRAAYIATIFFALTHLLMFTYMDGPVALLSTMLAVASSVPLAFLYEYGNNTVWSPAIVHTTIRTVGLVVATDEKHFGVFSLIWIVACMVIPYIVLVFYKDFRRIWTREF